jgi:hypothetical protein
MKKVLLLWLVLLLGVHVAFAENPPFTDVTSAVGLDGNREGTDRAIGQAWGDFDGDGWVDLYVTDTDGENLLFRNVRGQRFERVDDEAVALWNDYSGGAIFADYDNDGDQDLYVLNWGENVLLQNDAGTFVDVTETAGVGGGDKNSQTASWGDYDEDGFLDLYVANWACYDRCGRPQEGDIDRFYHNNGDGTFTNVTNLLGGKVLGAGFVASFIDFDNDGDSDIYLVNDEFINPVGNALWRNDGAGCGGWCWAEISAESNADSTLMGMGLATADFDRDGYLDFFFSNAGPMELLRSRGDGTFENVALQAGVEYSEGIGWGTLFFDYNNDGWQDLYIAIMDGSGEQNPGNPLFRNFGDGTFGQVFQSGANDMGKTLGVASADYDQDGRVDLIIGNIDEGYKLYRNVDESDNRWIAFKLNGADDVNRDAVGSRVYVTTNEGTQMQEIIAGGSLGAGSELVLHFGVSAAASADVEIVWTNGERQLFEGVATNQRYTLTYGDTLGQTFAMNSLRVAGGVGAVFGVGLLGGLLGLYLWLKPQDTLQRAGEK